MSFNELIKSVNALTRAVEWLQAMVQNLDHKVDRLVYESTNPELGVIPQVLSSLICFWEPQLLYFMWKGGLFY
jgi:hypothetical protein